MNTINEITARMLREYQKSEGVKSGSEKLPGGNAAPGEKVDLSTTAREIQTARGEVDKLPDVRDEKVQELRAQIEQGTYSVSAEDIAEKIVAESLVDVIA